MEHGELTRGQLEVTTVQVQVSTGQPRDTVVLPARTGPEVTTVQAEQSIVRQQTLAELRETAAGPAAVREQAPLRHRRVVNRSLSLAAVTPAAAVTRVAVVVTRVAPVVTQAVAAAMKNTAADINRSRCGVYHPRRNPA
jgi:hypothetical protein